MIKKLLLLIVINFFLLKAFSQSGVLSPSVNLNLNNLNHGNLMMSCPPIGPMNINVPYFGPWSFDTVGVWSNYLPFVSTTGGEYIIVAYSPCSTTYVLSWQWSCPTGNLYAAYKEHDPICVSTGWTFVYFYNSSAFYYSCELPLDSNKLYDIILDYNIISGPGMPCTATNVMISVPEVTGVSFDSITPNSVRVNWTSPLDNIDIEYGLAGFVKGNGTKIYNASNHSVINNLMSYTGYDFYLKQQCGNYGSFTNNFHKVRTAQNCDSMAFLYCDNKYITQSFDPYKYPSWILGGCGGYGTNTEKIFQFIPDTSGIYNLKHIGYGGTTTEIIYMFYKDASLGCNEKNWTCIATGSNKFNWNGSLGPLVAGSKYYISFYGSLANGSCCNNFFLTCPSPQCSQPSSSLNSNAINNSICIGSSTSLFPIGSMLSASGLYHWYKDSCSGAAIATTKYVTVSPTANTNYYLQITDSCGTIACDSITITVNNLPVPVLSLNSDTTICSYDSLLIHVNKSAGDSVQWIKNGVAINASNDSMYFITDSGSYSVVVFNQWGCSATSDNIKIKKSLPDKNLNFSGSASFCQGDSVNISSVNVISNTYQWIKNGTNINGAAANNINVNDSGAYQVFITDSLGCVVLSDTINIALLDTPQVALNANGNILCANDSILILTSKDYQNIKWFLDGVEINGAIDSTYYAIAGGTYTVTVIDSSGCSGSSQPIIIYPSMLSASVTPGGWNSICSGDSIQLSATQGQGLLYQWFQDGLPIANATSDSIIVQSAGLYNAQVTDSNSCTVFSDTTQIYVFPLTPVTLAPADSFYFCDGSSVLIQSYSSATAVFEWKRNGLVIPGADSSSILVGIPGYYAVTVTNINGCINTSASSHLMVNCYVNIEPQLSRISQSIANDDFYIVPNPTLANGFFNVYYNSKDGDAQFRIYDMTGKKVYEKELKKNVSVHSVESHILNAGLYNCILTTCNSRKSVKLVVK